jgi:hypothetical protein
MNIPKEVIEDFRNHLYFCFKYLGLSNPTPKQYAMAELLQNGPNDFLLQAGRGDGKSVITACYVSWRLLLNPNRTQLVLSATGDKAIKFVAQVRQTIRVVPYMFQLEPQEFEKDSAFGFNVHGRTVFGQDLSVSAKGITSQITGSHADDVLCDDIEIPENSDTPASREKLWERCMELENVRNKITGATIRFLGTPQTKDSVYNRLATLYPVIKFPAVMPDISSSIERENVSPYILSLGLDVGSSTQPERFSDEVLLGIEAKIGPSLFALHYKLDTTESDAKRYPLHLSDLIVFDVDPRIFPNKVTWANAVPNKRVNSFGMRGDSVYEPMWVSNEYIPYLETCLFIDPSGRGSDETSVCVASFVNGYVVVHALLGFLGGYDTESLMKICQLVNYYGIKKIRYESNYGDGMFGQILRPIVGQYCRQVAIEEYKVTGNKESRIIASLEPIFAQHRLIFNTSAITEKETQIQITRLTDRKGCLKHDDRIDVLSEVVKYWMKGMAMNPEHELIKNKMRAEVQERLNWLSNKRAYHVLGDKVSGAVKFVPHFTEAKPKNKRGFGISILKKGMFP